MVVRCTNPTNISYPNYGGRGIRICQTLRTFDGFLSVMGERPTKMTIDRIDNDGHYSCGACDECESKGWPKNCRWATPVTQAENRRSTVLLEYNGESLTASAWGRRLGIYKGTIAHRIAQGWTVEAALTTPVTESRFASGKVRPGQYVETLRFETLNGETMSIAEWGKRIGVSESGIYYRLRHGWTVEQAITTPRRKKPIAV